LGVGVDREGEGAVKAAAPAEIGEYRARTRPGRSASKVEVPGAVGVVAHQGEVAEPDGGIEGVPRYDDLAVGLDGDSESLVVRGDEVSEHFACAAAKGRVEIAWKGLQRERSAPSPYRR